MAHYQSASNEISFPYKMGKPYCSANDIGPPMGRAGGVFYATIWGADDNAVRHHLWGEGRGGCLKRGISTVKLVDSAHHPLRTRPETAAYLFSYAVWEIQQS